MLPCTLIYAVVIECEYLSVKSSFRCHYMGYKCPIIHLSSFCSPSIPVVCLSHHIASSCWVSIYNHHHILVLMIYAMSSLVTVVSLHLKPLLIMQMLVVACLVGYHLLLSCLAASYFVLSCQYYSVENLCILLSNNVLILRYVP